MSSEVELPQGEYVVGEDLPSGKYLFTAQAENSSIDYYYKDADGDPDSDFYSLNQNSGMSCRLILRKGTTFKVTGKVIVQKAPAIELD